VRVGEDDDLLEARRSLNASAATDNCVIEVKSFVDVRSIVDQCHASDPSEPIEVTLEHILGRVRFASRLMTSSPYNACPPSM